MIAPTRASAAARSPGRSRPSSAHPAGGRLGQAEQQPDQRGLAGAVGAEEAEGDAARHLEVDAVERRPRAEPLAEADRLNRERVEVDGGSGEHATTVRAGRSGRLGRRAERGASVRMSLLGRLIRSDESRSTLRRRERRRRTRRNPAAGAAVAEQALARYRKARRQVCRRPCARRPGDVSHCIWSATLRSGRRSTRSSASRSRASTATAASSRSCRIARKAAAQPALSIRCKGAARACARPSTPSHGGAPAAGSPRPVREILTSADASESGKDYLCDAADGPARAHSGGGVSLLRHMVVGNEALSLPTAWSRGSASPRCADAPTRPRGWIRAAPPLLT